MIEKQRSTVSGNQRYGCFSVLRRFVSAFGYYYLTCVSLHSEIFTNNGCCSTNDDANGRPCDDGCPGGVYLSVFAMMMSCCAAVNFPTSPRPYCFLSAQQMMVQQAPQHPPWTFTRVCAAA
jgi:hypothetical protein